MKNPVIGFVGLGNMGAPMAANLVRAGHSVIGFDIAGSAVNAPNGVELVDTIEQITSACDLMLLSLPNGPAVIKTAQTVAKDLDKKLKIVVDHSTIGIEAAQTSHELLRMQDVIYLDAPVSGGTSGAKAGTLALMASGNQMAFQRIEHLLAPMAKKRFFVGEKPGQAQAMKLLNNFLSATAMTATSEAIAFGAGLGLDPNIMIDVLNSSSGQNTATRDKFPQRILTETYDAGFTIDLLNKDVALYLDEVSRSGGSNAVATAVSNVVSRMQASMPGADFTRIYPFTVSE
jgi:3-hydroxyisobutyrate dehydrogenase